MSRDYSLYLEDIVASATKVLRYTQGTTFQDFIADERTYDAVLRNLEIIGESAKHAPEEMRQRYPQIAWRKIAGLRDVLAHGYFGLEDETLWDIVQNEVPPLLVQVQAVLSSESSEDAKRETEG